MVSSPRLLLARAVYHTAVGVNLSSGSFVGQHSRGGEMGFGVTHLRWGRWLFVRSRLVVCWRSSPFGDVAAGSVFVVGPPRSSLARCVRRWPGVFVVGLPSVLLTRGRWYSRSVGERGDGVLTWHRRWVRWRSFVGVGDVAVLVTWWSCRFRRWAAGGDGGRGWRLLARWRRRDRRCGRAVGGGWAVVVVVVGRNN